MKYGSTIAVVVERLSVWTVRSRARGTDVSSSAFAATGAALYAARSR